MSDLPLLEFKHSRFMSRVWRAVSLTPVEYADGMAAVETDADAAALARLVELAPSLPKAAQWHNDDEFVVVNTDAMARLVYWDARPHEAVGWHDLAAELDYWGFAAERRDGVTVHGHPLFARGAYAAALDARPPPVGHFVHPRLPLVRLATVHCPSP